MAGPELHDDGDGDGYDDGSGDEYDDGYDDDGYDDDGYDDGAVLYDDGGMRPSRRPLYVGLVALVLVAAAVIGFVATRDDEEPPATFSLAAAAANAAAAERVAYDLSARLDGEVVTAASGVLDLVIGSQQLDASARTAADGSATAAPTSFVLDAARHAVYVESSAFASVGLLFDRPYVRIDLAELADGVEVDTAGLLAQYGGNPLAAVPLLGRTPAQDLGAETIAGEQVEHFRVQLSVGDLLAASPALAGFLRIEDAADEASDEDATAGTNSSGTTTATATTSAASGTSGTTALTPGVSAGDATPVVGGAASAATVVVDVYVTETNVLRRLVFVASAAGSAIGTVTFTEYDGDVHVVVPPSDQVIVLADVFGA